jgi:hypothetical protein
VKIAVRFFNFDWIQLVAEIRAVRRPPRTGDTWIKLHMSVFGGWMELVAEVSCRVPAAHNHVTYSMKSTLGCIYICKVVNMHANVLFIVRCRIMGCQH